MRENIKSGLKFLVPILICISSIHLLKENSFSWYWYNGHLVMTEQAIGVMSNDIFLKYHWQLKDGSIEPDKNRIIDHINVQECAYTINSLAKKCETMIRNNEDWSKIMFTMGQATHYIQDLNCPHHGIGYYIKGDHEQFEERLMVLNWKKDNYDGFYHIKNYKIFAINTSNFSKRYLPFTYELKLYSSSYDDFYKKLITPLWAI